ncbi:uncharacterized protein C8A04DRAFT_10568 [Dichotomopilus funicola]|uniref:Uncharacterized protein n=1 Tax=Dichotomopilus funicola TaxID=1934379 RepID=A0AAN6ZPI1_9PEZI|nr:hypothetical protein C8A04DRAFT_10568 [Dichotomopilus funicola]
MNGIQLIQTLAESFVALSDEVQSLVDRKTILEHKLRYAHEQYQYLADKYVPAAPEIAETLANLQLPPDLHQPSAATSAVPLPKRSQTGNNKLQLALVIREGRRAAQELAAGISAKQEEEREKERRREAEGSVELSTTAASPDMDIMTSVSTALEKDFTVEGKKGDLACPFSARPNQDVDGLPNDGGAERVDVSQDPASPSTPAGPTQRPTPTTRPSDPICAAMLNDQTSAAAAAVPPSCPIRYLDKHTPEEIAQYVETHKHAIPRSHEVCVRRYQRNEDQIRKLDAKYGSLVNMVKDLSHLHRPMMPPSKAEQREADRASNRRVEDWANTVVVGSSPEDGPDGETPNVDDDREGRFDRPMRDVRVGESPSRPWGISVPLEAGSQQPGPSAQGLVQPTQEPARAPAEAPRKCPFDHTKMFPGGAKPVVSKTDHDNKNNDNDHNAEKGTTKPPEIKLKPDGSPPPWSTAQPTFVNLADVPTASASAQDKGDRPQVVFNISGPVFIGYPMEQAVEFMKQFQGR